MKPPRRKPPKTAIVPSTTQFWLLKSEPDAFSWDDLVAKGRSGEPWSGVRNYMARNTMRLMRKGDLGFFYHSNDGREIVGVLKVIGLARPDPSDDSGRWECVDVTAVTALQTPVALGVIKAEPKLAAMVLVTNSRLSVQPVGAAEWGIVCRMGGLDPGSFTR